MHYGCWCSDSTHVHVCQTKHHLGLHLGGVKIGGFLDIKSTKVSIKRQGSGGEEVQVQEGVQQECRLKFRLSPSELVQNLLRALSTSQRPLCVQQVWCLWCLSVEFPTQAPASRLHPALCIFVVCGLSVEPGHTLTSFIVWTCSRSKKLCLPLPPFSTLSRHL